MVKFAFIYCHFVKLNSIYKNLFGITKSKFLYEDVLVRNFDETPKASLSDIVIIKESMFIIKTSTLSIRIPLSQ